MMATDHVYTRSCSILPLSFSTHLYLEPTGCTFTLKMTPFYEIEMDIEEGGMLEGTKIEAR